ncbi:carboxypeptidase-like regulatory domain-containing protein [Bacteroidota bacterium]
MRHIIALLFISFLFVLPANSQDKTILKGIIYDSETGESVPLAHIIDIENGTGTASDYSGEFQIIFTGFPVVVEFTHIAYKRQSIRLKNKKDLDNKLSDDLLEIYLKPLRVNINEVVVKGPFKKLLEREPFHITDFLISKDEIFLLGNRNNSTLKPELLISNLEGKLLMNKKIKPKRNIFGEAGVNSLQQPLVVPRLFKDCLGNIHLVQKDSCFQIYFDGLAIQFLYGSRLGQFNEYLLPARVSIDNTIFFEDISKNGQYRTYFSITKNDSVQNLMSEVGDRNMEAKVKSIRKILAEAYRNDNRDLYFKLEFELLAWYKPVYSYMTNYNDSVILINFFKERIEYFNKNGIFEREVPISFHLDDDWEKYIIKDEINQKIYNVYKEKNFHLYLKEIDVQTGKPVRTIHIPDLQHIEKLQVHNNTVYFLYQPLSAEVRKKLYTMKI